MFINGSDSSLLRLLVKVLEKLFSIGVSKVVIACITAHHLIPKIPSHLRKKIISLVDLVIEDVLSTKKKHLLLCSNGTRYVGIFQSKNAWSTVQKYSLFPDDDDQIKIHDLIYQIKINPNQYPSMSYFDALVKKYNVDALIAGCTEFHSVTKYLLKEQRNKRDYDIVDPLFIVASNFDSLMNRIEAPEIEHGYVNQPRKGVLGIA